LLFRPIFWLFAAFIVLCGVGHWFDLLTLWMPVYGIDGVIKAATACTSVGTAIALWLLLPKVLAIPSAIQLREANTALRETNRQMHMAEHLSGVGYWRLALPTRTLQWSDQVFHIFDLDPAGVVPSVEAVLANYRSEDRSQVAQNLEQAIVEGCEYTEQVQIRRPNGELRSLQTHGVPERAPDGSVMAVHGVLMDVTERAQAEEVRERLHNLGLQAKLEADASNVSLQRLAQRLEVARERAEYANHAKSRFLATMSHELRTPLHGVLGYAQLLQLEGGLTPNQSAHVNAMMGAGKHLLQMINRVLDLTEIEANHVELHVVDIDLQEIARDCLEMIRPAAEAKYITLSLIVAPDLAPQLTVDPTRLRQVLLNLLGNAVKFTARGSIELRLLPVPDQARLRIEVVDTGPGIPHDQRHLLFQDFERLEAEVTASVEGAGLGLAVSARLAALMGGRIGHEDNPPGGSVFWLELPLGVGLNSAPPLANVPITALPDPLASPTPLRALRVLVVDDVAMNRDIAGAFLCANGHDVTNAEGGLEAVAVVTTTDFDVVLMDVRMPGVDGIEATRRIRLLKGPRGHVPIVALTAQAFPEQAELCRQAGMTSHVTKPFTPEGLNNAVVHAAEKRPFPATISSTAI
jgi:signal transduction histidine kinase/ActR/RegA family two-component response regulator